MKKSTKKALSAILALSMTASLAAEPLAVVSFADDYDLNPYYRDTLVENNTQTNSVSVDLTGIKVWDSGNANTAALTSIADDAVTGISLSLEGINDGVVGAPALTFTGKKLFVDITVETNINTVTEDDHINNGTPYNGVREADLLAEGESGANDTRTTTGLKSFGTDSYVWRVAVDNAPVLNYSFENGTAGASIPVTIGAFTVKDTAATPNTATANITQITGATVKLDAVSVAVSGTGWSIGEIGNVTSASQTYVTSDGYGYFDLTDLNVKTTASGDTGVTFNTSSTYVSALGQGGYTLKTTTVTDASTAPSATATWSDPAFGTGTNNTKLKLPVGVHVLRFTKDQDGNASTTTDILTKDVYVEVQDSDVKGISWAVKDDSTSTVKWNHAASAGSEVPAENSIKVFGKEETTTISLEGYGVFLDFDTEDTFTEENDKGFGLDEDGLVSLAEAGVSVYYRESKTSGNEVAWTKMPATGAEVAVPTAGSSVQYDVLVAKSTDDTLAANTTFAAKASAATPGQTVGVTVAKAIKVEATQVVGFQLAKKSGSNYKLADGGDDFTVELAKGSTYAQFAAALTAAGYSYRTYTNEDTANAVKNGNLSGSANADAIKAYFFGTESAGNAGTGAATWFDFAFATGEDAEYTVTDNSTISGNASDDSNAFKTNVSATVGTEQTFTITPVNASANTVKSGNLKLKIVERAGTGFIFTAENDTTRFRAEGNKVELTAADVKVEKGADKDKFFDALQEALNSADDDDTNTGGYYVTYSSEANDDSGYKALRTGASTPYTYNVDFVDSDAAEAFAAKANVGKTGLTVKIKDIASKAEIEVPYTLVMTPQNVTVNPDPGIAAGTKGVFVVADDAKAITEDDVAALFTVDVAYTAAADALTENTLKQLRTNDKINFGNAVLIKVKKNADGTDAKDSKGNIIYEEFAPIDLTKEASAGEYVYYLGAKDSDGKLSKLANAGVRVTVETADVASVTVNGQLADKYYLKGISKTVNLEGAGVKVTLENGKEKEIALTDVLAETPTLDASKIKFYTNCTAGTGADAGKYNLDGVIAAKDINNLLDAAKVTPDANGNVKLYVTYGNGTDTVVEYEPATFTIVVKDAGKITIANTDLAADNVKLVYTPDDDLSDANKDVVLANVKVQPYVLKNDETTGNPLSSQLSSSYVAVGDPVAYGTDTKKLFEVKNTGLGYSEQTTDDNKQTVVFQFGENTTAVAEFEITAPVTAVSDFVLDKDTFGVLKNANKEDFEAALTKAKLTATVTYENGETTKGYVVKAEDIVVPEGFASLDAYVASLTSDLDTKTIKVKKGTKEATVNLTISRVAKSLILKPTVGSDAQTKKTYYIGAGKTSLTADEILGLFTLEAEYTTADSTGSTKAAFTSLEALKAADSANFGDAELVKLIGNTTQSKIAALGDDDLPIDLTTLGEYQFAVGYDDNTKYSTAATSVVITVADAPVETVVATQPKNGGVYAKGLDKTLNLAGAKLTVNYTADSNIPEKEIKLDSLTDDDFKLLTFVVGTKRVTDLTAANYVEKLSEAVFADTTSDANIKVFYGSVTDTPNYWTAGNYPYDVILTTILSVSKAEVVDDDSIQSEYGTKELDRDGILDASKVNLANVKVKFYVKNALGVESLKDTITVLTDDNVVDSRLTVAFDKEYKTEDIKTNGSVAKVTIKVKGSDVAAPYEIFVKNNGSAPVVDTVVKASDPTKIEYTLDDTKVAALADGATTKTLAALLEGASLTVTYKAAEGEEAQVNTVTIDGTNKGVTIAAKEGTDFTTAGEKTLVLTYTEDDFTKDIEFKVSFFKVVSDVSATLGTTEIAAEDLADLSAAPTDAELKALIKDAKVAVTYKGEETATDVELASEKVTVALDESVDLAKVKAEGGELKLNVTYTESESNAKTASITLTVAAPVKKLTKIEAAPAAVKVEVKDVVKGADGKVDVKALLKDVVITATYNGTETEKLTLDDVTITPAATATFDAGTDNEITLGFEDQTAKVTVTVADARNLESIKATPNKIKVEVKDIVKTADGKVDLAALLKDVEFTATYDNGNVETISNDKLKFDAGDSTFEEGNNVTVTATFGDKEAQVKVTVEANKIFKGITASPAVITAIDKDIEAAKGADGKIDVKKLLTNKNVKITAEYENAASEEIALDEVTLDDGGATYAPNTEATVKVTYKNNETSVKIKVSNIEEGKSQVTDENGNVIEGLEGNVEDVLKAVNSGVAAGKDIVIEFAGDQPALTKADLKLPTKNGPKSITLKSADGTALKLDSKVTSITVPKGTSLVIDSDIEAVAGKKLTINAKDGDVTITGNITGAKAVVVKGKKGHTATLETGTYETVSGFDNVVIDGEVTVTKKINIKGSITINGTLTLDATKAGSITAKGNLAGSGSIVLNNVNADPRKNKPMKVVSLDADLSLDITGANDVVIPTGTNLITLTGSGKKTEDPGDKIDVNDSNSLGNNGKGKLIVK